MSQRTRDSRSTEQRLENEVRRLRRRGPITITGVVPGTTIKPIDHIFEVVSNLGISQPSVTIDGTHFIVTVEVWTGGTFAAGTETPVITNKGSGRYRVTYAPVHPGSVYRTVVKCKPDGTNFGIVTPDQFQETPLNAF